MKINNEIFLSKIVSSFDNLFACGFRNCRLALSYVYVLWYQVSKD